MKGKQNTCVCGNREINTPVVFRAEADATALATSNILTTVKNKIFLFYYVGDTK